MAAALTSNSNLEQLTVGNVVVGSFVKLRSSGETCTVTCVNRDGSVTIKKSDGTTIYFVGGPGKEQFKEQFDPIPAVLPVKQLRENTITELSFTHCTLGVDGGIMLAALLATNTSVTVVDASSNSLRAEGAMALRDTLKVNTSLKEINLSNNEIGMWTEGTKGYMSYKEHPTPEGPAALSEGLAANTSVTVVDVRNNGLDLATKDRLFQVKNKKTTLYM